MTALAHSGHAKEFLKDQYRHCKAIMLLGEASQLLEAAGIPITLVSGEPDPGLLLLRGGDPNAAATAFITAVQKHRAFERETDPPRV